MSEDDRIHQSSERRLEQIRAERGVPVRRAPLAVGALIGGALGVYFSDVSTQLLAVVRNGLASSGLPRTMNGSDELCSMLLMIANISWPALLGGLLGTITASLLQTGGRVRKNFAEGLRFQTLGVNAAGGASARMVWALVMIASAGCVITVKWPSLAAIPAMTLHGAVAAATGVILDSVCAALICGSLFAVADVWLARWRWERNTWMTESEAREERRRNDGDPEVKARRQQLLRRRVTGDARRKEVREQTA